MAVAHQRLSFPMRPTDKEQLEWSSQYDDFFAQYLDSNTFDPGSHTANHGMSDEFGTLFSAGRGNSADIASPIPHGVSTSSFSKLCSRAALSDTDLSRLDELCFSRETSPNSAISSPSPHFAGKRGSKSAEHLRRSSSAGVRKAYRKLNPSPSMAQSTVSRYSSQDLWSRRFSSAAGKFSFPAHYQNGQLSTPPSGKSSPWDDSSSFQLPQTDNMHQHYRTFSNQSISSQMNPSFEFQYDSQFTPLSSPMDENFNNAAYFQTSPALTSSYFTDPFSPSMLQTPDLDNDIPGQALRNDSLNVSYVNSTQFHGQKVQPWWSPGSPSQRILSTNYQPEDISQSYQTHSGDSYHHSRATSDGSFGSDGLMINCGPANNGMVEYIGPSAPFTSTSHSYESAQYSSATSPKKNRKQSSTRSPSTSPVSPATRSSRNSKGHRRNKTSSSGSSTRPTAVGFVNFTPEERDQILTGVAPSGSSKTKARREKEAAEKRRRLSQAAAKAVMEAGGDITALEKEGLLEE